MRVNDVGCVYLLFRQLADQHAVKSDDSLIFKRLKELNSFHRIIMTGVSHSLMIRVPGALTVRNYRRR